MLPQQLQAGAGEVAAALPLPGLVGPAAGQLTSAPVSALRERQERAQALAGAARTAALLEALDWTGPTAWPGLTTTATTTAVVPQPRAAAPVGRQHLIGDLSPEDCDTHLARRLTLDDQALIDADIRTAITARSHGLPLPLDLAVSRFLEIRRTGHTPTPADFDCTSPALLARTLSDLTPDERHLARSVALLDAFDLDLAIQTAGLTHQAPARRLTERPLVTENLYALWPYYLHRAIRSAVRDDNRWTKADWHRAATRALAALGDQWTNTAALAPVMFFAVLQEGRWPPGPA
ncbi:hypothetical protein ACFRQM_04725 [Streptomyces sp. NPDC056831]|uniref:hypothetical protein n=1 Tax=Streptomyces sp. NPDC056831 TaxID=3345954 RepID=UPI0036A3C1A9